MTTAAIDHCKLNWRKENQKNEKQADDWCKQNNGGSWFYVNRVGFPMDASTWEQMWEFASKLNPAVPEIRNGIRSECNLPEIPVPHVPLTFSASIPIADRLESIQKYLRQLQYNHTGTQFFDIKKNRPICGLMDCAKDMIRESLPIKCLEAVVLAIYLTNYIPGLDRFPLSFRSIFKGHVHRHVVLGVHFNGKYGALGMSRRDDLMYKPLSFEHLSQLITDFNYAYRKYGHTLDKVKIGLTISHDSHTYESIQWRAFTLNLKKLKLEETAKEIDKFAREIKRQTSRWQSATCVGAIPNPRSLSLKRNKLNCLSAETVRTSKKFESRLSRDRRQLALTTNINHLKLESDLKKDETEKEESYLNRKSSNVEVTFVELRSLQI